MTDHQELTDVISELEDARDEIKERIEAIRMIGREYLSESSQYRLERGVLAHIETSLSNDHGFLGGNMFTLEDTINELKGMSEDRYCQRCRETGCECGGTEDEEVYSGVFACTCCSDTMTL